MKETFKKVGYWFVMGVCGLLLLWMILSFFDVQVHNMCTTHEYSWNVFYLMGEISEAIH